MSNEGNNSVIGELIIERAYQLGKWSIEHDNQHTPGEWIAIGDFFMESAYDSAYNHQGLSYRNNLLKAATVFLAAVEAFDRVGIVNG